jgi:uncharacterized protein
MSIPIDASLTDDELIELDDFLLSAGEDSECLTIDEAHGYLSALAVTQLQAEQDQWLEAIWGTPAFEDEAVQERITGLLLRMYEDIAATLEASLPFEPLIIENEVDGELLESYEGWCYGFMLEVGDNPVCWEQLSKDEDPLLLPIAKLAMQCNEDEPELDEEEYQMLVELLPGSLAGLHAFFAKNM